MWKKLPALFILLSLCGCGLKVKDMQSAQQKNMKASNAKIKAGTGTDLGFEKQKRTKGKLRLTNMPASEL
ncbi:MAG: hypothetical protein U0931_22640 [Vulcanimicrobiota bacterium]